MQSHLEKHREKRSATNFDIVTKTLYNDVDCVHKNHWREGLAFLRTHNFREATFRQTLITFINFALEEEVLHTFFLVLVCCVEAHKLASDVKLRHTVDYRMEDIWLLPFCFERLVLAPNPNPDKNNKDRATVRNLIRRRLRLFRSGQLQLLYDECNKVTSKSPDEQASNPVKKQRSAQLAADNDNPGSAKARLTKESPVVPVTDGPNGNLGILERLHPKSYALKLISYVTGGRVSTRSSSKPNHIKNHRHFAISPKNILLVLRKLKRGKAVGPELDSLDIFIKLAGCYTRKNSKKQRCSIRLETLASFFTIIANGEVPSNVAQILRTTYLVPLAKDPNDHTKLRPIGVPSAIRRITAICAIFTHQHQFANYLLPFNVAIGVNGGIDLITNTFRLGVEKYITAKERDGGLPTRALVSLDIVNMFNAMSRQKLRQLIARDFPELAPMADMLYKEFGTSKVRMADGTWRELPVEEGFTQGCPLSPIFAAIVLNHILKKVHTDLMMKAVSRAANGNTHDDGIGGAPILMVYVDDTNALVPLEDVEDFLLLFNKYGNQLGAILNLTKTKILTSTKGAAPIATRLNHSMIDEDRQTGTSLTRVFTKYLEETQGLRVLGVPLGSTSFCTSFIMDILSKAVSNSKALIDGLDSDQTILQLFKICTAHKMTHLFVADVLNNEFDDLPNHWHLYHSDMATAFNSMVEDVLSKLTNRSSVPPHVGFISSISTSNGGLGIQNPRSTAIPAFMLTTRRVLQYTTSGVWIGKTLPPVQLPTAITCLYSEWQTSSAKTFQFFRRYISDISEICVNDIDANKVDTFLSSSSINTCRERICKEAAEQTKQVIERAWQDDPDSLHHLEDLLEPRHSFALVDMSRLLPKNRLKNEHFGVMLRRKLRLALWPGERLPICFCGKAMDSFGDHVLSCRSHCKTAMSDATRNGLGGRINL